MRACQRSAKVVAPRRGAWIETDEWIQWVKEGIVAPRRGAWIETFKRLK